MPPTYLCFAGLVFAASAQAAFAAAPVFAIADAERAYDRIQFEPASALLLATTRLDGIPATDPARAQWLAVQAEADCVLSRFPDAVKASEAGLALPGLASLAAHRLTMARVCAATTTGEGQTMLTLLEKTLAATDRNDKAAMADVLAARGSVHNTLENAEAALEDLYKALAIAPRTEGRTRRADVLVQIAYVQYQSNAFKEAERNMRAAIADASAEPPSVRLSIAQFRLASLLIRRGAPPALAYTEMLASRNTAAAVGDRQGVAYANYGLGKLAFQQRDFEAAAKHMQSALPVFVQAGDAQTVGWVHLYLARIELAGVRLPAALDNAAKALAESTGAGDEALQRDALELRSRIHAAMGARGAAYDDLLASNQLNDKLTERQRKKSVIEMQSRFDSQKQAQDNIILKQRAALQDAELSSQRKERLLYLSATVALGIALVAAMWGWWLRFRHGETLRKMAETDALTGLVNRRRLADCMAREFGRAQRYGLAMAVAIIDIDFFKKVNDTYGHPAGDAVLAELARVGLTCVRQDDVLARLGGEEFVLMMPHTGLDGAQAVIERIRASLADIACPQLAGTRFPTFSAGVAIAQPGDASADAVLARADAALYLAKEGGRNRTQVAADAAPRAAA